MVVCALPLPLVAIPMALTLPPHDPAKQNTQDDQNPSAVKHLLGVSERYCAILAADFARKNLRAQEPTPRPTRAQQPDAHKANALQVRAIVG
eukprot:SAG31_NODE_17624_length_663_cov_5.533688_1_plen_92_part_00